MSLHIADLSHWQEPANVDYSAFDGFIVKASQGHTYIDPMCATHISNIRQAGKPFGLYHYFEFNASPNGGAGVPTTPELQVSWFKQQIDKYPDASFMPALDVEMDTMRNTSRPANYKDLVCRFLDAFPNHQIMLYASRSPLQTWLAGLGTYYTWQAEYTNSVTDVAGYIRIGWQYTSTPIDMSWFDDRINKVKAPTPPQICVDQPANNFSTDYGAVNVVGWTLQESGILAVNMFVDGQIVRYINRGFYDRPDVQSAYPQYSNGLHSGFAYTIALDSYANGSHVLRVSSVGIDGSMVDVEIPFTLNIPQTPSDPPPVTPQPPDPDPTPTQPPYTSFPTKTLPKTLPILPHIKIPNGEFGGKDLTNIFKSVSDFLSDFKSKFHF